MQLRPTPAPVHRAARQERRVPVRRLLAVVASVALVLVAGCGVQPPDPVQAAQTNVATKQKALADAQSAAAAAEAAFCDAGASYLTALDRYGDLLVETAPTVGDVREAGKDLLEPQQETLAAGEAVKTSRDDVATAEQELAEAEAMLANAQASASGQTPTATAATPTPSPTPSAVVASVTRVKQAESDFASTVAGITDETPLRQASEEFTAAVVALEMAWLLLFADSGCLTDPQQEAAVEAVHEYTVALQEALAKVGLYKGEIDGIYGPQTVAAVKALQEAHGLTQTGVMDKATEAALRAELVAKAGADAMDSIASTASLQQTLKRLGYYEGDVDGIWSDELTEAIKEFQDDLGVPATGEIDAETIAAIEKALEDLSEASSPSPTPTPSPEPSEEPTTEATPTASPTG